MFRHAKTRLLILWLEVRVVIRTCYLTTKSALQKDRSFYTRGAYLSQAFFVLVCGIWGLWTSLGLDSAPIGLSIGVLAFAAVIMTVRAEHKWTRTEQAIWIIIAFCLFLLEVKSIYKERSENNDKQAQFLQEQRAGFQATTNQSDRNFKKTAEGLETAINGLNGVLATTQKVSALAKQNLESVTGGESFGEVIPGTASGSPIVVLLHNAGKQQLTGVKVRVSKTLPCSEWGKVSTCSELWMDIQSDPFDMGSIAQDVYARIPTALNTVTNLDGTGAYRIEIRAQNGEALEHIWFKPSKSKSGIAYRFQIQKTVTGKRKKGDVEDSPGKFTRMLTMRDWQDIPPIQAMQP